MIVTVKKVGEVVLIFLHNANQRPEEGARVDPGTRWERLPGAPLVPVEVVHNDTVDAVPSNDPTHTTTDCEHEWEVENMVIVPPRPIGKFVAGIRACKKCHLVKDPIQNRPLRFSKGLSLLLNSG